MSNELLSKMLTAIKAEFNEGVAVLSFSEDFLRVEVNFEVENKVETLTVAFDADASYNFYNASPEEDYEQYCEYYFRGINEPLFYLGSEDIDMKNQVDAEELAEFCKSVCDTVNNVNPTVLCYEEPIEGIDYIGSKKIRIEPIG